MPHTDYDGSAATIPANFDKVARLYRSLEYLTLGRALERCRFALLPLVRERRQVLVFGDGDGRALAPLFAQSTTLAADVVDSSPAMLRLLQARCHQPAVTGQLRMHCEAAEIFASRLAANQRRYDLVTTHFFLDCLTNDQVSRLVQQVSDAMTDDALWLVSEFRIPGTGWLHLPARALVTALYAAFRILTGLRVTKLPDYEHAMTQAGLRRIEQRLSLGGILTSELWTNRRS